MNPAYVHLWLNHFPVLGTVFGFLLLVVAVVKKSEELKKVSLSALILTAMLAIPTYLTGESAEEVVEHLPGVTEEHIEQHEESALASLVAVEILGVIALGGLFLFRGSNGIPNWFVTASLILSVAVGGLMVRTAHLGGQIRHTEIRAEFKSSGSDEATEVQKGSERTRQNEEEKEQH
ncbi:MAG: hypothetical protein HY652_08740 [Acidobacteria bacterium]|nr:hypothetical protein [Acidobacteriota bacterium]